MNEKSKRITGFDFARALAILGMVIVNYKLSMGADGKGATWIIYFTGLFEGRASAIFVILAGIGISLMTKKARVTNDPILIKESKQTIWKRAFFLLLLGISLYIIGWNADILHYYAFYMFLSSFYIVASNTTLLYSFIGILTTAQIFQLIFDYTKGWNASFHEYQSFWTLEGFLRNLLFNGFHPIFPWFCFLLLGLWLGRLDFTRTDIRKKLLWYSSFTFIILESLSFFLIKTMSPFLGREISTYFFSTKPMPPNIFYILSSSSTAIIVIILCVYFTEIFAKNIMTKSLILTGQMALTHYIGHVLFLFVLAVVKLLENQTLFISLMWSVLFFICAIFLSYMWKSQFKRGPVELLMRKYSDS
ncbi:DUF418 domain-containing protein [Microbacteriaceae bacterium 4G12]